MAGTIYLQKKRRTCMENKNKKFSINYHKRLFLNGGGGGVVITILIKVIA
jgi:hypothetical protein